MKIVLFAPAEMLHYHRRALIHHLENEGWEVYLLCPPSRETQLLRASGWKIHELAIPRGIGNPLKEFHALLDLRKFLKLENPDLVHVFTLKAISATGLATALLYIPQIYTFTGLGTIFTEGGGMYRFLRPVVVGLFRKILNRPNVRCMFENPDDARHLCELTGVPLENVTVVAGAGIDVEKYIPHPTPMRRNVQVLMATRLVRTKGVREYAAAGQRLKKKNLPVDLLLAGWFDPQNPQSLNRPEIDAWEKSHAIRFLGRREDMLSLLGEVDIVVLPSYREGLPRILIEAASMGKPVITTDVPGCREAVIDGFNGLLVPPRDENSLAEAIEYLVVNHELRAEMGQNSRQLALERFDERVILARTRDTYQAILDARIHCSTTATA